MAKVSQVIAREIYDSRGTPTVEAEVTLDDGSFGRAAVPSGASTGIHEAVELRDGDKSRLRGLGVRQAVNNVNTEIKNALTGCFADQNAVDEIMVKLDGTANKSRLGANAILSVSMALSKAAAASRHLELWEYFRSLSTTVPDGFLMPVPMMNVLNGGRHASGSSDFQEYMLVPAGAKSFSQSLEMGAAVFMSLKTILSGLGFPTTVGDEGGFAPSLGSNEKPLEIISQAVEAAGLRFGEDVSVAIDAAASEFFKDGRYTLKSENRDITAEGLIDLYAGWTAKYPLISIEDGLEQDDWSGYEKLTQKLGGSTQIVGDDLFVTNVDRLQEGISRKVANAILIKLNQIGTVTETVAAIDLARKNGYKAIVSHRSGETEDTTIADFVVGLSTGQIKTGSLSRSERIAKYNQLLRIEEKLGSKAVFPGFSLWR
jgi:enolase